MVRKDLGVVLKSARSGETSKLVTFLGREAGKISLLGKGALGPRSPFRGSLELGNLLEVVYYYKEGRTLFFLKEASVQATLGPARDSLSHLACAMAILELLENVCYWRSPEAALVDLVTEFLAEPTGGDPLQTFLIVEFKVLERLGIVPDLGACTTCGQAPADGFYYPAEGTSCCARHAHDVAHRVSLDDELLRYASSVARSSIAEGARVDVSRSVRKRFGQILHWTYNFHVQGYRLPNALKLLHEKKRS